MTITITSKRAGFRRCGMAHPAQPVTYDDDTFSTEELKVLKAEPMLVVVEDEASKPETKPKPDAKPKAEAEAKSKPKPKAKPDAKPKAEAVPEPKPEAPQVEAVPEPKTEAPKAKE